MVLHLQQKINCSVLPVHLVNNFCNTFELLIYLFNVQTWMSVHHRHVNIYAPTRLARTDVPVAQAINYTEAHGVLVSRRSVSFD
jgi:hypothetical protein